MMEANSSRATGMKTVNGSITIIAGTVIATAIPTAIATS